MMLFIVGYILFLLMYAKGKVLWKFYVLGLLIGEANEIG
jgi:hypothetical protein